MAESKDYSYRGIDRPTLPYISYASSVDTAPHFLPGSQNTLGTAIGYLEKRPGFSTKVFATPYSTGVINRLFPWERWDGTFFLLASATDGTNSYVAASAYPNGGSPQWTTIFTLSNSTQPFDFVVSRNLVFFGNGTVGSMNKWDGVQVTKWGVDAPTIAPTFSFTTATQATATATETGGVVQTPLTITNPGTGYNPSDPPLVSFTGGGGIGATAVAVVSAGPVTGATVTVAGTSISPANFHYFNVPIIGGGGSGLTVNITVAAGHVTAMGINQPGMGYTSTFTTTFGTVPFGGTQATFQFTVAVPFGEVTAINVTNGGSGYTSGPTVVIDPPGISAYTGYYWGYTYTTIYGHESNMSPLSGNSGIFTENLANVLVTASADMQVNGINLYRTTDGGSNSPNEMQLDTSVSNSTQVVLDSVADVDLQLQTGPALLANTPPTPCYGFVYWNSRIWGFLNGTLYFSGAEEISNGVPEEAWPSGLDGNFQPWPQKVYGLGQTPDLLAVGLANQFWQETGDSLDTFRIALLLDKRGVRAVTAINSVGGQVVWFDKSHQLWVSSQGEVGQAIRPDLANVDSSQAYVGMHVQDVYHWIYVLDPVNHILYTYDLDLEQWNTPWTIPGAVAIVSGELTAGETWLMIAFADGNVCYFTPGTFNDNGTTYADGFITNLINVVAGGDSTDRNRDVTAQIEQFEIEVNSFSPDEVLELVDDDPMAGGVNWEDITAGKQAPSFQTQGTALFRWIYRSALMTNNGSRVAFTVNWNIASNRWVLYTMAVAYRKVNL